MWLRPSTTTPPNGHEIYSFWYYLPSSSLLLARCVRCMARNREAFTEKMLISTVHMTDTAICPSTRTSVSEGSFMKLINSVNNSLVIIIIKLIIRSSICPGVNKNFLLRNYTFSLYDYM